MKHLIFTALIAFAVLSAYAQAEKATTADKLTEKRIVEASCGSCNFGMKGGCFLAVKIDGKSYPVDGFSLHDFGDPHVHNGMCNKVRKAEVSGEVVKGRFKAKHFVVLPEEQPEEE
ncbi:MAG: hypothetical protein KatS3mg031_0451 [Chitinophagales bacterium]|nr:MAG: hypothetical protein KatS3mg031_0451 [Chitinophagales bacterium]